MPKILGNAAKFRRYAQAVHSVPLMLADVLAVSNFAKVWDFVWGMLLIGMLPMFAFCIVLIPSSYVNLDLDGSWVHKFLICFLFVANFVVPIATLYFVARWRQKHRRLPASLLGVEVLLGVLLAGSVFIYTIALCAFASIN